jgi:hypothetical protein
MKKALYALLIVMLMGVAVVSQTTPNLGFNVPVHNAINWDVLLNANFVSLDTFLGAGSRTPGQVTVWTGSGLTSYTGFTSDSNGNVTVGSVTSGGAGTFLSLATNGSGGGKIQVHTQTISTVPTCNGTSSSTLLAVSDSNTQVWGATYTGSSGSFAWIVCDGSNWTVFAK